MLVVYHLRAAEPKRLNTQARRPEDLSLGLLTPQAACERRVFSIARAAVATTGILVTVFLAREATRGAAISTGRISSNRALLIKTAFTICAVCATVAARRSACWTTMQSSFLSTSVRTVAAAVSLAASPAVSLPVALCSVCMSSFLILAMAVLATSISLLAIFTLAVVPPVFVACLLLLWTRRRAWCIGRPW